MADPLPADIQKLIAAPPGAEAKKGSSVIMTIVGIFILTLAAAGAGGFLGLQLFSIAETAAKQKAEAVAEKPAPEYAGPVTVKVIPPIIANLSNRSAMWLRIEASVIFDGEAPEDAEALATEISGDSL